MNTNSSRAFLLLSAAVGSVIAASGCGRDTLIGIGPPEPGSGGIHGGTGGGHPGPISSGGVVGTPAGSGGVGGTPAGSGGIDGGTGGTPATPPPACPILTMVPGQLNDCGRTSGVAYSPDGTLLAAVTEAASSQLHVWRLTDGQLMYERSVTNDPSGAYGVSFSPDGKLIATAGNNPISVVNGITSQTGTDTVVVWDAASGAHVATLPTHDSVYSTAAVFSPDGTRLVTAGAANAIEFWNVADWTLAMTIPYTTYSIYALHFSPDGQRLLASSAAVDTIFNVADGSMVAQISGLVFEMNEASYSPDGQRIFTIGGPGQLQILDASAMTLQLMTFSTGPSAPLPYIGHGIWIGNDSVVADDFFGTIEEWSKDASQQAGSFSLAHAWSMPDQALGMAAAPDGKSFVVGGGFGITFLTP